MLTEPGARVQPRIRDARRIPEQAHAANEFVDVRDLEKAVDTEERFIRTTLTTAAR